MNDVLDNSQIDSAVMEGVQISPEVRNWINERQTAIMQVVLGFLYKASIGYPLIVSEQDLYGIVTDYVLKEYRNLNQQVRELSANRQNLTE